MGGLQTSWNSLGASGNTSVHLYLLPDDRAPSWPFSYRITCPHFAMEPAALRAHEHIPSSGRAAVSYKTGDVVIAADPFVHVLCPELKGKRCDACIQKCDKLKRCAGCSLFQYCDKACQLTDWKSYHKHGECEFYRKLAACPDKEAANHFLGCHYGPILLRLYLIVKANPAVMLKKYQLHNGKERCLKDLMDNEHDEDESGINPEKLRMTCTAMLDIDDKLFAPPDFDLIKSLFHKLRINSFSIDHMEESGKSIALYIQTSVFDHSCRSNAAFVFIGKRMQIRAMKDIQEGEEVTIHYVDIMETKKERRDKLWKDWGFLCRCFRCEEHESEEERMELAAYKHYLNSFSTQPNVNMSSEQEQISDLFTRSMTFLPIREKYLGHYHPELTYSMFLAASAKSSQPDMSPQEKQELAALINKVESAAIITHGKEHEFYFMISILRATTCLLF